ncbi:MAG: hypothetical protein Q9192_005468, partial [Flavoplaca navasiana]
MKPLFAYFGFLAFACLTHTSPVGPVQDSSLSNVPSNPSLSLLQNTQYRYHVPGSPITLLLIVHEQRPIERPALFRTIFNAQQALRRQLSKEGNRWLDPDDDPYQVDDKRTGKCMIGMKSIHPGSKGGERLTYLGVLDVMQGLWDVLYLGRNGYNTIYQVKNGSVVVGNGKIVVGNGLVVSWQFEHVQSRSTGSDASRLGTIHPPPNFRPQILQPLSSPKATHHMHCLPAMNPSPWPGIPPITASDLRTYVNENRDHALALLQSAAASAGKGPMVEMPRGSLLIFLTNIIAMCNITPFQAREQDKLEKLDSVNAKLTTFHNFIRESRITCRMCGQCSDKQDASVGIKSEQIGHVRRIDDGSVPGRRNKSRDGNNRIHIDRTRSVRTADRLHRDHVFSHEQDCQLGTLPDPRNRDSGIRFERQKEHGNQRDDAALIEEADALTASNLEGPHSRKRPLEVSVPTGRQEGHGQEEGQARPQLYQRLDNQIPTNPYEGEAEGDLVSHTVQEDTSGTINPETEEQAIQARRDAVEDR